MASQIAPAQQMRQFWRATIICSLAMLFYVYEFTLRTVPSAITHELMRDFQIQAAGLGLMTSLFYWGYTPMQIPVGLLYDKLGARLLLTIAMACCVLGTILFGASYNLYLASFAFFIIGFASSFAFIGTLVLASRWFPAKYFAMIAGIVQFMGSIGAVVGQAPISLVTRKIGWHHTLYWLAGIGFIILMLIWTLIRDGGSSYVAKRPQLAKPLTELQRLAIVCKNSQTWWTAVYAFTSWAPMILFAGLWGIPFLMVMYHVSAAKAAIGTSILWLGNAFGSPFFGWWSNYIHLRRMPMVVCSIIGFITAIYVLYIPHPPLAMMYIALFFFGVASSGQMISFGVVHDNNPSSVEGTAIGFNNMAVIIGGIILPPMVGLILKFHWNGAMQNNVPIYNLSDYHIALAIIPLCSLLGLVVAKFFIHETRCHPQYGQNAEEGSSNKTNIAKNLCY